MNLLQRVFNCFKKRKNYDSEKNYRTLLETIQDGVFVIQDGKFVYINDAFSIMMCKKPSDVIGKEFEYCIHPDDIEKVKTNYHNRLNGGKAPSEYEFKIISDCGNIKYLNMTVGLGMYRGKVASMGTVRDVSKKHIIDSSLQTLKNAVEHSPGGLVITDRNGTIEYVNPQFTEMTGFYVSDVLEKTPRILKSGKQTDEFYDNMWETILSGKEWNGELRNKKKDGTIYWEKQSISPIFDEVTGEITHFVGVKEDITEWKKLKEKLVKAKEKAEESDNLKTSFLASMSHEIRTPMNSIIGFTDLLRDEDMSKDKREKYTNHISNAGDTLLNLIDDIIDIAKIEAGQMKITEKICDLSELMDGLYKTHLEQKNKISKDHIDLIPNGDNVKEQLIIKTDCHRLTQILNNIIGNAIKFTEQGYVRFGYLTVSDELLQFYIKDTGIGIPDDELGNIFDRFRRVENDEKIYSGTGLGLAITKNLVELLGGKIWVESAEDIGSIFYFTLPYEKISKKAKVVSIPNTKRDYDWSDKTILIAEDEKLNYTYLSEVINKTNATILWAQTGSQAVNLYRKHKDKINVILMDIKMPKMSGYDAMKIIREKDNDVPIIVQTAHVISGDKDKSFEAGCNEYLTKPIKYGKLLNTIDKYISYDSTD